jgi:hypothetical protein
MLTLSVRQPWPWLICVGRDVRGNGKNVENRGWSTSYRGELQIHAGKTADPAFEEIRRHVRLVTGIRIPDLADLPRGGIVGKADLVVVLDKEVWFGGGDPRWARFWDSLWFSGRYGWGFDDARPLPFRPCPGQLGLWDVDYASLPAPPGYAQQVSLSEVLAGRVAR